MSQGSILRPEKAGCSCSAPYLASPFPRFPFWGLLATPATSRPPASPEGGCQTLSNLTPRAWV